MQWQRRQRLFFYYRLRCPCRERPHPWYMEATTQLGLLSVNTVVKMMELDGKWNYVARISQGILLQRRPSSFICEFLERKPKVGLTWSQVLKISQVISRKNRGGFYRVNCVWYESYNTDQPLVCAKQLQKINKKHYSSIILYPIITSNNYVTL